MKKQDQTMRASNTKLLENLQLNLEIITNRQDDEILEKFNSNVLKKKIKHIFIFLPQFKNPIVMIFLFAVTLLFLQDSTIS